MILNESKIFRQFIHFHFFWSLVILRVNQSKGILSRPMLSIFKRPVNKWNSIRNTEVQKSYDVNKLSLLFSCWQVHLDLSFPTPNNNLILWNTALSTSGYISIILRITTVLYWTRNISFIGIFDLDQTRSQILR